MALVDAGRDRDAERPLALRAALALARDAARLDDLALAVAARTGADVDHLAEHRLADRADLTAAVALRAGRRLGPRLRAAAFARLAALEGGELDLLLGPLDRLLEGDPQVIAQVRTGLRPSAPRRSGTRSATEERIEDVREATEPLEPASARTAGAAVHPGPPERVVARSALGVGQDLVGLVDLLELFLRGRIRVDVGVPLLGELAVGALDLGVGRGPLDAEDHVEVALRGCHRDERIREVGPDRRGLPSRDGCTPPDGRPDDRPRRDLRLDPARRLAGQVQPRRIRAAGRCEADPRAAGQPRDPRHLVRSRPHAHDLHGRHRRDPRRRPRARLSRLVPRGLRRARGRPDARGAGSLGRGGAGGRPVLHPPVSAPRTGRSARRRSSWSRRPGSPTTAR